VLRTTYRAPRQNAICERFLGSVRRECLDHVLILGEAHLQRVLKEDVAYFNQARPQQGIGQAIPAGSRATARQDAAQGASLPARSWVASTTTIVVVHDPPNQAERADERGSRHRQASWRPSGDAGSRAGPRGRHRRRAVGNQRAWGSPCVGVTVRGRPRTSLALTQGTQRRAHPRGATRSILARIRRLASTGALLDIWARTSTIRTEHLFWHAGVPRRRHGAWRGTRLAPHPGARQAREPGVGAQVGTYG